MVTVEEEVIWDFPLSEWHCQDGLLGVGVMGEGWRNIHSAPFPIGYRLVPWDMNSEFLGGDCRNLKKVSWCLIPQHQ